jgi:hypothetical protein
LTEFPDFQGSGRRSLGFPNVHIGDQANQLLAIHDWQMPDIFFLHNFLGKSHSLVFSDGDQVFMHLFSD